MRFIVKDGILRGVNTDGTYFMDSSNHAGLVRVRGVNIKNPGISLGELPQDLNSLYSLSMVNGVGEINENPVPSRAGLFIDYPTLEILFNKRLKGQPASVNGLGALAALLGEEGMSVLEGHIMGLGDFEYGGRDDINGLEGDGEMEFSGMNGLSGLGQYLGFNAAGDSIAVMDGLGITRHVRVRRRGAAAPAAAPAANAAPAPPSEKKIGLYVPVNTLRNLFKLRAANLARLQANGHLISSGTVPTAINGLGDFGEIGSWFSNITNSINKAASFISPVANFLPVPGLSTVVNIAKTGSGLVQKLTGGNESPWAAATREALAKQDYTARYLDESKEPYNISVTENLQGIPVVDSAISYAKENPVKTVLGVAAAGAVVWYLWPAKKSGKTLGGTPAKKTGGKDKKGTKNYIMAAIK